jgi:hypothetical protein
MKRLVTLVAIATSLLLVTAVVPAVAKKPPEPEPAFYELTLQRTGDAGLGTCDEASTLTMLDIDGHLLADGTRGTSEPRLYLTADVPWSRTYPAETSGTAFDGCHGGALEGSDSAVPSYFVIHGDSNGKVTGVLWAFDVYTQAGTKGKNRTPAIKEFFRLWDYENVAFEGDCDILPTDTSDCSVSGTFGVWHYYPIEEIGTDFFEYSITITRLP